MNICVLVFYFFFNDTATTEIYTLSLHDALPISSCRAEAVAAARPGHRRGGPTRQRSEEHTSELQSPYVISYAAFCLKKTKNPQSAPLCNSTDPRCRSMTSVTKLKPSPVLFLPLFF